VPRDALERGADGGVGQIETRAEFPRPLLVAGIGRGAADGDEFRGAAGPAGDDFPGAAACRTDEVLHIDEYQVVIVSQAGQSEIGGLASRGFSERPSVEGGREAEGIATAADRGEHEATEGHDNHREADAVTPATDGPESHIVAVFQASQARRTLPATAGLRFRHALLGSTPPAGSTPHEVGHFVTDTCRRLEW